MPLTHTNSLRLSHTAEPILTEPHQAPTLTAHADTLWHSAWAGCGARAERAFLRQEATACRFCSHLPPLTEGRWMARGRKTSLTIRLTPAERQTPRVTGHGYPGRLGPTWPDYFTLADGVPITAIAATVGISRRFIYKWAWRFLEQGLADWPTNPAVAPDAVVTA